MLSQPLLRIELPARELPVINSRVRAFMALGPDCNFSLGGCVGDLLADLAEHVVDGRAAAKSAATAARPT